MKSYKLLNSSFWSCSSWKKENSLTISSRTNESHNLKQPKCFISLSLAFSIFIKLVLFTETLNLKIFCLIASNPSKFPGDNGDYFSGTGIFMRGLLEAISIVDVKAVAEAYIDVITSTLDAMEGTEYEERSFSVFTPNGGKLNRPTYPSTNMFNEFNKMTTSMVLSQLVK